MIVVDVNVVAYLHLVGTHTAAAQAVFAKDAVWAAPPLWREEFVNLLAKQCRFGGLAMRDAEALLASASNLMSPHETAVEADAALRLAVTEQISGYDAHYVALAQKLHVPFVTEDREILRKLPKVAVSPADFVR